MPAKPPQSVLIIDDDERFAATLAQALARRGFATHTAHDIRTAMAAVERGSHDAAIVDLRLGDEDGLELVEPLRAGAADMRILVLTGYASIATAVKAIKLGADDYLAKPVTAGTVVAALTRGAAVSPDAALAGGLEPMSPRRLEWEHIQRVLAEHAGNVSATARTLGMHRRTLQRKLAKRPTQR
jgi:two-component system response regulator RegA